MPGTGCSPGFWKTHLGPWTLTGYSPEWTVQDVFEVPDEYGLDTDTLLAALDYEGGGGADGGAGILLRAAVAALLNAAHPDVDYPRTPGEVVDDVNTALSSGDRDVMIALKDELDIDNNLGCPLE